MKIYLNDFLILNPYGSLAAKMGSSLLQYYQQICTIMLFLLLGMVVGEGRMELNELKLNPAPDCVSVNFANAAFCCFGCPLGTAVKVHNKTDKMFSLSWL